LMILILRYFLNNFYSINIKTISGGVPEWLKGTGCKPVGYAYVGSNPTPSTSCRAARWKDRRV
jgi:hypothetical protein